MRRYLVSLLLLLAVVFGAPAASAQTLVTRNITTSGADCSTSTACGVFGVKDMPSIGIYLNVGSSGTFVFEATIDGTTWFAINDDVNAAGSATVDGAYFFTNPGYSYIRLRASAISGAAVASGFRGFSGLRSTATLSGEAQGDGSILDGVTPAIKATVLDLTSANPVAVAITDATGAQIVNLGGGGATGAAVPSSASYSGVNVSGTLRGVTGLSVGSAFPYHVAIVDGSGNQITSFGGGTQYATGTASATPTGTVALGWDGANVRALSSDASGNLQVEFGSAQTITATNAILTSSSVASDGSAGGATTMFVNGGLASTSAPSWTTGRQVPFSFDLSGGLRIGADVLTEIKTATESTAASLTSINSNLSPDAVHANTVIATGPQGVLEYNTAPVAVTTGQAVRAQASSKGEAFTVLRDAAGNGRGVNVTASNQAEVSVTAALPAGTNAIGKLAANSGVDIGDVDVTSISAGTNYIGKVRLTDATNDSVLDPCKTVAKSFAVINQATSSTTEIVATGTNTYYICSINLVTATAQNVALISGTTGGTACNSNIGGMAGGTTAATGWNFAANGGLTMGNGDAAIFKTTAAARAICLVSSGSGQISGSITYVER